MRLSLSEIIAVPGDRIVFCFRFVYSAQVIRFPAAEEGRY